MRYCGRRISVFPSLSKTLSMGAEVYVRQICGGYILLNAVITSSAYSTSQADSYILLTWCKLRWYSHSMVNLQLVHRWTSSLRNKLTLLCRGGNNTMSGISILLWCKYFALHSLGITYCLHSLHSNHFSYITYICVALLLPSLKCEL